MRTEVLAALNALDKTTKGTFSVVGDLPWSSDGLPLYVKNLKRIYVDISNTDVDTIFDTLGAGGFAKETTTTEVYMACDAKTLPSNYDSLVSAIKALRISLQDGTWHQRRATVETELEADVLITTITFAFERVVNN